MPVVPDVPETPHAAEPQPVTRAQRRAERAAAAAAAAASPASPASAEQPPAAAVRPAATSTRPVAVGATVAFAGLVALTGYTYSLLIALAVALTGAVLAWGWPVLLSLPSPRGTTTVLGIGVGATCLAATAMDYEPFLEWIPAALAVSLLAAFLHQLLRRDGRPRLVESLAATAAGLAILAMGACYLPLPRTLGGAQTLAAAMAAVAASAFADLALSSRRMRPWALPLAMVLGGGAALLVGLADGRPTAAPAALIGLLAAGVAHAIRRVLAVLPTMASARAQLASAAASVLICGVVVYTLGRVLIA
jgi:hypothetical protein